MSVQERPLRADAERNRRRLLDAARTLFAQRGLEVSLDDIAHAAGVGVGTAYRRFRSRDEIVEALFDEHLAAVVQRAEQAAAEPDAWTALTHFFLANMRAQAENRGLKQLLHQSVDGREKVAEMRQRTMPLIEGIIARAKADGSLREDVELTDFTVLSVMIGASVDFVGTIDDCVWERYATILFDGLRAGSVSPLPREGLSVDQLESAMQCWKPARR